MNVSTPITDHYLLTDLRYLTTGQGAATLAKSYQPYGETLSSMGNGSSPFAFTGEQTDVSGLTYLRARYYSSGTGRFLTRDTWMGEYTRPLSLNRWGYVEGNPVNYADPSGLCGKPGEPPCPDWWNNRSHLYVEGYGYFDVQHLLRGWTSADWMQKEIDSHGQGGGLIRMESNEYYAVYRVFTNLNRLDKEMKIGIMYGIYIDFEIGYEKYQGRSIFNWNFPSSFSPEDLPSDHLGFWTYVNGYSKNKIPDLLLCLGKVWDRGNFILNNLVLHASYEKNDNRLISSYDDILPVIYGGSYYRFSLPKNYEFLPMVADYVQYENGEFETRTRNTDWPSQFQIQPIPSGPTTWRKEYELEYK